MVELNKIYHGDSLEILKTFPAESINCVITSPPYWAIRDYKVNGQLGLELTFHEYKSKKYYFKQLFDPYASSSDVRYRQALRAGKSYNTKEPYKNNFPYSKNYKRGHGAVVSRGNDGDGLVVGGYNPEGRNKRCIWSIPTSPFKEAHFATFPEKLIEPMILAGCPEGKGIVLDPFMGAGTTAIAAKRLKRNWIGIELNPEYIKIAEKRISKTQEMLLV